MSKISVILLAGGRGTRFGSALPKQYLPFLGKPIALHSLERLRSVEGVEEVVVVCHPEYRRFFRDTTIPLKFALPGILRQESVFNGLREIADDADLILIHDSVRPLIKKEYVAAVIEQALKHGAATVAVPVKFTVKEVDEELFVSSTLDRSKLWEIQTPQVVKRDILRKGFLKLADGRLEVTDDVSLAELLGYPVKIVRGDYSNIKITTVEDLNLVMGLAAK